MALLRALAIFIIPIAILANVVRIIILVLLTWQVAMRLLKDTFTELPAW